MKVVTQNMSLWQIRQNRKTSLGVTVVTLLLIYWGQNYGVAEIPHTAACLTLALPLGVMGWLMRSALAPMIAFLLVAIIQLSL